MSVDPDLRTGLYVAIPLYFLMLACVSYWAYVKTDKMKKEGVNDALSAHYLAGRSFGPILSAGTMFASMFSGYTVVGVPNEAYYTGWLSLRWIASGISLLMGFIGTGLRLRKASLVRNHQSPSDFITDRYQCQILRYTIVFLQVVPSLIYLSVQVIAIQGSINYMFGLAPDVVYPVIIIMAVILLFEWAGGLSSVALTDAIQGLVMVLSFIMLPCVIKKNFGGWVDLDPDTYPRPQFYQTPTEGQQWLFWQFVMSMFGFFSLPHFIQRTYAARDVKSLKFGYMLLNVGAWFTLLVGTFIGTVGVEILGGGRVANPFAAILEQVMLVGGFAQFVGVVAFTASLAAIMSTADSLIIGISQLITSDIVYPIRPASTPVQITWIGRFVSLCSTIVAVIIALLWDEGIDQLGPIQFGISFQAVSAFIVGLFAPSKKWDVHPWCLAAAAWVGTIVVFAIYFGYLKVVSNPRPLNPGIFGFACQLGALLVFEGGRRIVVWKRNRRANDTSERMSTEDAVKHPSDETPSFSDRPVWDFPKLERFGERPLTPSFLWKLMEGVNEPMTNAWLCFFMFLLVGIVTPLVPESEPPLDENGDFVSPPATFNGLPWWAFKIILLLLIPTMSFFVIAYGLPNSFALDDDKVMKDGVDVDSVMMTANEMGRRNSYDEKNSLIQRRRSSIGSEIVKLHLEPSPPSAAENEPSLRRLSALVKGESPVETFGVDISDESDPVDSVVTETPDEEAPLGGQ